MKRFVIASLAVVAAASVFIPTFASAKQKLGRTQAAPCCVTGAPCCTPGAACCGE